MSTPSKNKRKKVTTLTVKKSKGEKRLAVITAYDATLARLVDKSDIDMILVGDSLGMVVQGHDTTIPVTIEQMVYHTQCVTRATRRVHVIGDLPFMTYQQGVKEAVINAGKLMKEGGAHSVKLEGGIEMVDRVAAIVQSGIPVAGHVGLTPQSFHAMGGFRIQGKNTQSANKILKDAKALEKAGAFLLFIEGVPTALAKKITSQLKIPTIGIGAGKYCDGQVLVSSDFLGLNTSFEPKFSKQYLKLENKIIKAFDQYCQEVQDQVFPAEEHSF